ncbi:CDP-glycerol glycerophosphotransferase family protein [Microbacterium aquilitoris]|uniref:CDP-glycerol glycerophosphotransferase family protein n=1 Tax=Microbacterium aquilitoris TaxID=3067307 RepID=UPI00288ECAE7|nr:CDP-glycerol glycerophosphotransferase family protein [Microbacterium sp. KSW2-22]MDT3344687.1 CDP-glycerol glycerophosphotransferase family protein [Microbacterium sp. KSW2-22]
MTDAAVPAASVEPVEAEQVVRPRPPFDVTVDSLSWERAKLTIRLSVEQVGPWTPLEPEWGEIPPPPVDFRLIDGKRRIPVPFTEVAPGSFELHVDVPTFRNRQAIPNGTWRIVMFAHGERVAPARFDGRSLRELDEGSRVFLYDGNRAVTTVSFGIAENSVDLERLDFLMRSYHLFRSRPKPKKFRPIKRLKALLLGAPSKQRYAGLIYQIITRTVGVKPGRILFASDQRVRIEGNLRRVQERIVERGLQDRFDMKYSFRLPRSGGWGTTLRIIYLLATSEIVLLDDYFGILKSLRMDPRTKVIQLWHAGSGFKSVGYSRFGNLGSPKLWHPHRQYTFAITGSEHLRHVYAEAFGIEEAAVIPTGLPRVDWFLDPQRRDQFLEDFAAEYPQIAGKKVVLFAPTFRGRSIYTAFYDYSQIDFDALYDACGDDTVVLFRMHHFVKNPIEIPEQYRDRFFDFTHYPDGLNLLHATDVLITDYSSIIYEFSLLDRPMLFFAPDRVNYAATRGFHRDYGETAPGRVADTFDDVIDALRTGEFEQEKVAEFRRLNFDRVDTGAADRVIDWLIIGNPDTEKITESPVPTAQSSSNTAESSEKDVPEEEIA